jgi:hypothetical protein
MSECFNAGFFYSNNSILLSFVSAFIWLENQLILRNIKGFITSAPFFCEILQLQSFQLFHVFWPKTISSTDILSSIQRNLQSTQFLTKQWGSQLCRRSFAFSAKPFCRQNGFRQNGFRPKDEAPFQVDSIIAASSFKSTPQQSFKANFSTTNYFQEKKQILLD